MARANDLVAFDRTAGELPGVMGADVGDRIKLAVEVEYRDLRIVHVHDPPLARRELPDSRYRHPFAHVFGKLERIVARAQFRSGLDRENFDVGLDRLHQILDAGSVPEIELGQLPHAPW